MVVVAVVEKHKPEPRRRATKVLMKSQPQISNREKSLTSLR